MPVAKDVKLEELRTYLSKLRKEREQAILEKGLAAEENKDLRENFAYDYWLQQEQILTYRIYNLIKEIEEIAKK